MKKFWVALLILICAGYWSTFVRSPVGLEGNKIEQTQVGKGLAKRS